MNAGSGLDLATNTTISPDATFTPDPARTGVADLDGSVPDNAKMWTCPLVDMILKESCEVAELGKTR